MAAPDAPGTPVLNLGPVPHSLHIYNAAVATATKYTAYLHGKTGVGQAAFAVKKEAGVPDIVVYDLPDWQEVFVAMTATNAGAEESADSTEQSLADWQ